MKNIVMAAIAVFSLSGCLFVVPVPPGVLSGQDASAVPMRAAPAGSAAARIGTLVNRERRARGIDPLSHNRLLDGLAARHAADMARNGLTGHVGSDGHSAHDRLKRAGYGPCRSGENVASGFEAPERVVREWMASPGHRRINLKRDALEYGVGHAPAGDRWVLLVAAPGC